MNWVSALISGGLGAIGAIGSSLIGAASASASNKESYKYTSKLQDDQQAFNSAEAQKARDYETEMSNSAYQRARADMEKAGFNPILAATQGGASTPVVGPATSSSGSVNAHVPDFSGFAEAGRALGQSAKEIAIDYFETEKNKRHAEVSDLESRAMAQLASAEASRASSAESAARTEKILKEAASIDPETERQNQRYGRSHGNQQLLDFTRYVSDWLDGKHPNSSASPSSAKGAKVMSDKARSIQEERRNRVLQGLSNPRRKGRR